MDASDDALHAALGRGTTRETGVTMPRHSSSSSSSTKNSSHRKPSGDGSSRGGATGSGTATSPAVGRGGGGGDVGGGVGTRGGHLARVERLWGVAQGLGYRLKLNTVVTAPCLGDVGGMVELVGRLRPERWKVFQVGGGTGTGRLRWSSKACVSLCARVCLMCTMRAQGQKARRTVQMADCA